MNTANTFNNSFKKFVNQMINFLNFADLKDFLKLSQEKRFFDAISKWPVFQKSFK